MYEIDLDMLSKSLSYFNTKAFEKLQAPMLVDKDIVSITIPKDRYAKRHTKANLYYVGSAEQSFYQILKDNPNFYTSKGMLLTPCERQENEDETHLSIFLKLELVSMHPKAQPYNLALLVLNFLLPYIKKHQANFNLIQTKEGYDIEINGIEVGSYGERKIFGKRVVYGTGLALPRISQALNKKISK